MYMSPYSKVVHNFTQTDVAVLYREESIHDFHGKTSYGQQYVYAFRKQNKSTY